MSVFGQINMEYPVYQVVITAEDSDTPVFYLVNQSGASQAVQTGDIGNALGGTSDQGLVDLIKAYYLENGWQGQTVSSVVVTKLEETSSSVS